MPKKKEATSPLYDYSIEAYKDPSYSSGIWHLGKVVTATGEVYTFRITSTRLAREEKRGRLKVRVDDTGFPEDRACEWRVEFGQPGLPEFFCRSDHKMAKRMICMAIRAFERGLYRE